MWNILGVGGQMYGWCDRWDVWKNYVEQKQKIFGTLRSDCAVSQTNNMRTISN
jgi:hypothetical protein